MSARIALPDFPIRTLLSVFSVVLLLRASNLLFVVSFFLTVHATLSVERVIVADGEGRFVRPATDNERDRLAPGCNEASLPPQYERRQPAAALAQSTSKRAKLNDAMTDAQRRSFFFRFEQAIPANWRDSTVLGGELRKGYVTDLACAVANEYRAKPTTTYPRKVDVFRALRLTPLKEVRVVIIAQYPYVKPGQADGLCFSVPPDTPPPPSLTRILRVMGLRSIPATMPCDLSGLARRGVLLLNASLTVEHQKPNSHQAIGWHRFTDAIVRAVDAYHAPRGGVCFMLWGAFARRKLHLLADGGQSHLVLTTAHPSPIESTGAFLQCAHFAKADAWCKERDHRPIFSDWIREEFD